MEFDAPDIKISCFYRPALHCSDDWLWYGSVKSNIHWFLVGDVTGHGTASAMMTGVASMAFRAYFKSNESKDLALALKRVHAEFQELGEGKYWMTLSAVEINTQTLKCKFVSAGAPPWLIMKNSGVIESVAAVGTAIGRKDFKPSAIEVNLNRGDRLFLFTDGLTELELPSAKQLGLRRLGKICQMTRQLDVLGARNLIVNQLNEKRNNAPLRDDLTFALIDV